MKPTFPSIVWTIVYLWLIQELSDRDAFQRANMFILSFHSFVKCICLNGKLWVQSHWFDNNKLWAFDDSHPPFWTSEDVSVSSDWFYCSTNPLPYPSLPPSPHHPLRANSHIAGMMKLMFYGPFLGYDKMTEREEMRNRMLSQMERKKKSHTSSRQVYLFPLLFTRRNSVH